MDAKISQNHFIIITTPLIKSIAENLQGLLNENGYQSKINFKLTDDHINNKSSHLWYIILINERSDNKVPKQSIFYQVEQTESNRIDVESASACQTVWDMSIKNYSAYESSVPLKKLFITPIPFYFEQKTNVLHNDTIYDILFYGSVNERRKRILTAVKNKFPKIKIAWNVFGNERDNLIKMSKIIVNLHFYKDAVLEVARFNEVLGYNKLVISECSEHVDDVFNRYMYKDCLECCEVIKDDLSNINSLLERIAKYLGNEAKYAQKIEFIKQNKYKLKDLSRYFVWKNLLTTVKPLKLNCSIDLLDSKIYCLTLLEAPDRFTAFCEQTVYKQNCSKFDFIPSIKYEPGWKGCGLSYSNLIYNAKRCKLKTLTICEDDCSFKADFAKKYALIKEFLSQLKTWDIFVGIVADLPSHTILTKIYKYKEMTFIEIDQMHSTVFNIYNSSVYNIILNWDFKNDNINTNQIDQYLKRQQLKIIVSVPFEFGCLDVKSTIWKGDLYTAYNKLFEKSKAVIKKLMEDYLKNNQPVYIGAHGGKRRNHTRRANFRRKITRANHKIEHTR